MNKDKYLEAVEMFYRNMWIDEETYEHVEAQLHKTKELKSHSLYDIKTYILGLLTDSSIRVLVEDDGYPELKEVCVTLEDVTISLPPQPGIGTSICRGNIEFFLKTDVNCEVLAKIIKSTLKSYTIGVTSDE